MATDSRIYLHHIKRLRRMFLSAVNSSQWQKYNYDLRISRLLRKIESLKNDLSKYTKTIPIKITTHRSGNQFYFKVNGRQIDVTYQDREIMFTSEVLVLDPREIQELNKCVEPLRRMMVLFHEQPGGEYDLEENQLSKSDFQTLYTWWALFDSEKEKLRHLFMLKFDFEYRDKHREAQKKKRLLEDAQQKKRLEERNTTYVYLMHDSQTNYYKIGQSKNPAVRESTLFSEKPSISLVCAWKTESSDEHLLHQKYMHINVRGEWFALAQEHIDEIYEYFSNREVYKTK